MSRHGGAQPVSLLSLLRGRNKTYLSEMSSSHNGNASPLTMLESEKCENPYDVLILRSWRAFSPLRNETMPCKAGRSVTRSVVSDSFRCHGLLVCQAPLSMEFSSKNTGVGCQALLQGIFPTQGSNPCCLYWQASFTTEPPGKLRLTETGDPQKFCGSSYRTAGKETAC